MNRNIQTPRSHELTINFLKGFIQHCHQQREKSLRQRKTIATPALHKDYPYHFTVHCARGCALRLYELEQADISFMPIGHAPEHDHAPNDFGGERFLKRQKTRDWTPKRWYESWGIQIYTGAPSGRNGAQWHDINFKYDAICAAPDAVFACIEALVNAVANPLLTLTKSGGLRFSCRVSDYLHPNSNEAKHYIHKHAPTEGNPYHREVYLEILGEKGYSCWDGRHEILLGNLLEPPTIAKEVLFIPIDALRDALHEPASLPENNLKPTFQAATAAPLVPEPINEKVVAVREGKLSPLAIKRLSPVLSKSESADSARRGSTLHVFEHDVKTGWLCAVDEMGAHLPFLQINIPKDVLDAWDTRWQQNTLGNFAKALLNALERKGELYENPVRRVRMIVQAFEAQEKTLIQQIGEENPNLTFWHQLKRFFEHYQRDTDAPMIWDQDALRFWIPSVVDGGYALPDEVKNSESKPWLAGNRVFQIRTGIYSVHEILNYENSWDDLKLTDIGNRFFNGIRAEIEKDSTVQHLIVSNQDTAEGLGDTALKENVQCRSHIKRAVNVETLGKAFESADVIWIVGAPYWPPHLMWRQAQILFGNDEKALSYDIEMKPYYYKDERIQRLCEQNIVGILTQILTHAGLDRLSNKTVVLLTGMPLPGITDRPETLLFDWEDFEIAGGLDKLPEVIVERQRFEIERANLTTESSREKVEQVLGISKSQANRMLMKLRGGKMQRVPFHEQIHALLEGGEKTTAELIAAIDGHPGAVKNELKRLVDLGEIVKVRRAVYALPSEQTHQHRLTNSAENP